LNIAARGGSAQVALDGAGVAFGGVVGVAAGVAQGAALALQVPQSVELDADLLDLLAEGGDGVRLLGQLRLLVAQLALAILEPLDLGLDLLVVHAPMVRDSARRVIPSALDPTNRMEDVMGDGTADDAKGRVKEAAGALTGDDSLKNEGKVDRASGSVKDAVGGAADKVKDVVNPKDDD
jgi:uncharacterized protein YjbJ (UPF0337 family)